MSSIVVLESLNELFPQVDNPVLKAASIEHANNHVISYLPTNSPQNKTQMDASSPTNHWRGTSLRSNISDSNRGGMNLYGFDESQDLYNSIVNSAPPKRNSNNNNNNNIDSSRKRENISNSSKKRKWDLSVLVANNKLAKQKGGNEANGSNGSNDFSAFESDLIARSSDPFNAEFLEDFVNYAKNNKMNLVVSVDSLTRMLRKASLSAGQETAQKIEELIEILAKSKII